MSASFAGESWDLWRRRIWITNLIPFCFVGSWPKEAFEAFSRPQGMDVGQAGRRLRPAPLDRPTQAARVAAPADLPEEPPQVRPQRRRGDQDRHAASGQG